VTKQFAEAEAIVTGNSSALIQVEAMGFEVEPETRSQAARPGSYERKTPLQHGA
jgi:hypothetical protein